MDEQLGPLGQPGMVQSDMVRDEIEHQPQSMSVELLPELAKSTFAPQGRGHCVVRDRKRGTQKIRGASFAEVLMVLAHEFAVVERLLAATGAGSPHTHKPYMRKSQFAPARKLGVGHV